MSDQHHWGSDAAIIGGAALAGYAYSKMNQIQRRKVKRVLGVIEVIVGTAFAWAFVASEMDPNSGSYGSTMSLVFAGVAAFIALSGLLIFRWQQVNIKELRQSLRTQPTHVATQPVVDRYGAAISCSCPACQQWRQQRGYQ